MVTPTRPWKTPVAGGTTVIDVTTTCCCMMLHRPAAMLLRTATDSSAAGLELQPRSSPNDLNAAAASVRCPPADTTLTKDAAGAAGCSQSSFNFKSKAKPSSSQPASNKVS